MLLKFDEILTDLFKDIRLNWYLDEKTKDGVEIVVAEVKGMSRWESEEETIDFIEQHAGMNFGNICKVIRCTYTLQREGAAAVEPIKIEDLQSFCFEKVQVAILDKDGEDQAPFVSKTIQKLELCPDNTHLRIYFDRSVPFLLFH